MGCVLSVCTCYYVDPQGSGWCSCKSDSSCSFLVPLCSCLESWTCCLCLAGFQDAVTTNNVKKARMMLGCLPPNIGSGVSQYGLFTARPVLSAYAPLPC